MLLARWFPLRKLNQKRADCQVRIGQINLPRIADCKACDSPCCNLAADEYFSPVDFWLRKYVDGDECDYSRRLIRKPGYYARMRVKHIASVAMAIPKRLFQRLAHGQRPIAEPLEPLTPREGPGCQFHSRNGCALSNRDRPIKCLMYACTRMRRALTRSAKSRYEKEIGELYQISVATFRILRKEVDRPLWLGSALLKFVP